MNTTGQTTAKEDVKVNVRIKLSALWAALMFIYIYADILSLFRPGHLEAMMSGQMGPFPVTQGSLLAASVLMIIPALMVFLSLTLKPTVSRWANIIVGVLYTAVNINNGLGETWAYYLLFVAVEIVLSLLIILYAWKWRTAERKG
jgi:hypothetical protein